jgi:hypothetical protein
MCIKLRGRLEALERGKEMKTIRLMIAFFILVSVNSILYTNEKGIYLGDDSQIVYDGDGGCD